MDWMPLLFAAQPVFGWGVNSNELIPLHTEDISIGDMADNLHLNRSYFSKLFKKITQKSPQDFFIQYRMHKACEMLRSTNMPVAQIAHLTSYNNPFHFSRAFRRMMEIAPQEWRKKISFDS